MPETRVSLQPQDYALASWFQEKMKRLKPGATRQTRGTDERVRHEIAGKLAEVCCGRELGLPVDWQVRIGGDNGIDFTLSNEETLDCKAVAVERNMWFDFKLEIGEDEPVRADHLALVLVAPDYSYGLIVGAVTAGWFKGHRTRERGWGHRGKSAPWVALRSEIGKYPFNELVETHLDGLSLTDGG